MIENKFDLMRDAIREANAIQRAADYQAGEMANMLVGRLRRGTIQCTTLASLKRELADYNIHTGRWK